MQNRIDRLEGLVLSLMTNGAQSAGPTAAAAAIAGASTGSISGSSSSAPIDLQQDEMIKEEYEGEDSEVDQVAKSIGVMKVDNNRAIFASEAHWYAILGEIAEVKNYFSEHKKQYEDQLRKVKSQSRNEESPGTALLFKTQKPSDKSEILQAFPPRSVADMLITRYFNTYDPGIHIIHTPTFQKEYDQHWLTPNETPVIWLGLAYSMMCLALQSYHRAGDEPPQYQGRSWEMSDEYRKLTAQCLILAEITQPIMYMLETLVLHIQAEYARSRDAEVGVLVSVSIIVRLAMRMGYHRDPDPYAGISPFQGEMRRRVWAVVRQMDLLFSSQAGLPPMIRSSDTNTDLPRNIYNDELFEDMKALPPSRPATEATPASYMIAKGRLIYTFGKVVEEVQSLSCSSYEQIMRLDQELRETQATLPPHLRMRPLEECARDPATLVMQRYTLELLYLKSQCVLHRKFLCPSRSNSRYAYSRRTCIDASMKMLQHQATLTNESRPGGRLRSVKWFVSSLTTHDFLLSAMIVCLDLYNTSEAERSGRRSSTDPFDWSSSERRASMMTALEQSLGIWEGLRDHSMEAYKAHASLGVMIDKLKKHQALRQTPQSFSTPGTIFPDVKSFADDANIAPEHSAAMTLGMLSAGGLTPNANIFDPKQFSSYDLSSQMSSGLTPQYSGPGDGPNGPANAPSPFSSLFGQSQPFQSMDLPSANIDWDAWDSYIQGTNFDPTNQMWGMSMDLPTPLPDAQLDSLNGPQQQQQQTSGQQTSNAFGGGSVFMGVTTPPRGGMM